MTKYLFGAGLLFSVLCCSRINIEKTCVIDLTGKVNTEKIENLSEVAKNISYIPLETKDSSIIGQIAKIIIREKTILVYDGLLKNILLFNAEGKFLRKISERGKGPLEYVGIQFVAMDKDGDYIYIGTFDKKIKIFNLQGRIEGIIALDQFADEAHIRDNSIILTYPYPYKFLVENYLFCEINLQGKVVGKFNKQFNENIKPNDRILYARSYVIDDTICFWEKYCDTIFGIAPDNHVSPRWVFKLPEPSRGRDKYIKVIEDSYDTGFNLYGFVETRNSFYISAILARTRNFIRFDKKSHEVVKLVPGNSLRSFGYNNDLDGGYPFWPTFTEGNSLYAVAEVDDLKTALIKNNYLDSSYCTYPEKKKSLRELLNSIDNDHNPLIIKVDIK